MNLAPLVALTLQAQAGQVEVVRKHTLGQAYDIDYAFVEGDKRTHIVAHAKVVAVNGELVQFEVVLPTLEHQRPDGKGGWSTHDAIQGLVYRVIDDDGAISAEVTHRPKKVSKTAAELENNNLVQLMGDRAQPPREPASVGKPWPGKQGWLLLGLDGQVAHATQSLVQPGSLTVTSDVYVSLADGFAGRRHSTETVANEGNATSLQTYDLAIVAARAAKPAQP
jgi:hypothetical protein